MSTARLIKKTQQQWTLQPNNKSLHSANRPDWALSNRDKNIPEHAAMPAMGDLKLHRESQRETGQSGSQQVHCKPTMPLYWMGKDIHRFTSYQSGIADSSDRLPVHGSCELHVLYCPGSGTTGLRKWAA